MLGPKGQPPGFSLPSHRPTISLHNTALCPSVPSQHNRLHRDRKNSLRTQLMRVPAATQCPQLTDTQALCSKTPHFILSTPQLCSYGGQAGAEKGPSLTAPLPSSPWPVTSTAVDSLAQEWGTGHSGIWPAPLKFSKQLLQKETLLTYKTWQAKQKNQVPRERKQAIAKQEQLARELSSVPQC